MMRFNAFGVYFLFRGVPVHVPCEMHLFDDNDDNKK